LTLLFITAFPPNGKTAGQDYSMRLLDDLSEKGAEISLIYAEYPGHRAEISEKIKVLKSFRPSYRNCLSFLTLHPFFTRRFDRKILEFIKSAASGFDAIYFDFSQVHAYSIFVNHPRKILMCHDVVAQKFSRKGKIFLPWIKFSEKKILNSATEIFTFSRKDCDFLNSVYGVKSRNVNFYLKNGRFVYRNGAKILPRTFCFYGAWNRKENLEGLKLFVKKIFPRVKNSADFLVIGGGMNEKFRIRLESLGVKCQGFVENPLEKIAECQALIAFLKKGAGVKVKVIDALSCGTPVIGTDVAFEGIEDNSVHKLFFPVQKIGGIQKILEEWQDISAEQKQDAADEFFCRYNGNRFGEILLP
jgi:glycosyltransferase involved in cell wall biosynthesis